MGKTLDAICGTITGTQPAESAWKKRMASAEWRRNAGNAPCWHPAGAPKWHLSP